MSFKTYQLNDKLTVMKMKEDDWMPLLIYICYSRYNNLEYLVLNSLTYNVSEQDITLKTHPVLPKTQLKGKYLEETIEQIYNKTKGEVISSIPKTDLESYIVYIDNEKDNYILPKNIAQLTLGSMVNQLHRKKRN